MIFMQYMWVFSTPYSTVLTPDVSTELRSRFVCKKKTVQRIKPSYERKLVDYRITAQLIPNRIKERKWTCAQRLGKCWMCQVQWGCRTASYTVQPVQTTGLGEVLH